MNSPEEHEALSDELATEGEALERRSDELDKEIKGVRGKWEARKGDPSVPGAVGEEEDEESSGAAAAPPAGAG